MYSDYTRCLWSETSTCNFYSCTVLLAPIPLAFSCTEQELLMLLEFWSAVQYVIHGQIRQIWRAWFVCHRRGPETVALTWQDGSFCKRGWWLVDYQITSSVAAARCYLNNFRAIRWTSQTPSVRQNFLRSVQRPMMQSWISQGWVENFRGSSTQIDERRTT